MDGRGHGERTLRSAVRTRVLRAGPLAGPATPAPSAGTGGSAGTATSDSGG